MAKGAGMGSKLAIVRNPNAWGTPATANVANAAIDYLSEDMGFAVPEFIDDASVSRSWAGDPIRGNISVSGSLRTYLRYASCEYLLAAPLGLSVASLVVAGATRHKYTYTSNIYGTNATLAIDKGVSVHEYPSAKFGGLTITGQAGRPTEMQARVMANNVVVPAGAKNASLASATYRSQGLHVLWAEQSLLVAAKAGAAPTSGTDRYEPSSWELTYDKPIAQHWTMNNSAEMIEPILDGPPTASLRLTFPRYATAPAGTPGNTFAVWGKANTALKLWLRAVGPTITGTTRHRFDLYAPNVFVANVVSNIAGPAAIPQEVTLRMQSTPSVPTGLPAWIGAGGFSIALTTAMATAPL